MPRMRDTPAHGRKLQHIPSFYWWYIAVAEEARSHQPVREFACKVRCRHPPNATRQVSKRRFSSMPLEAARAPHRPLDPQLLLLQQDYYQPAKEYWRSDHLLRFRAHTTHMSPISYLQPPPPRVIVNGTAPLQEFLSGHYFTIQD